MTLGPRTQTSPGVPSGTSRPSPSRMRISTPGIGRPTEPGLRAPTSGLTQVTGEHSVGPSPSSTGTPKRCSKADMTAAGIAAPPLTQTRTPAQAATAASSRRSSTPYMLGTPRKTVAP